jgi:hypothetical protein
MHVKKLDMIRPDIGRKKLKTIWNLLFTTVKKTEKKNLSLLFSISPSTNPHPNLIVKIVWLWVGKIHSITDTSEGSINYGYFTFSCGSVAQ